MTSLTRWAWVWVSSRSWWWTGKPGVLQSMGSQRVGHDWATELNWSYDQPRQHVKKQRHLFANKAPYNQSYGFSSSSDDKAFAWIVGDLGSIPELGRSSGRGNGNPLQCSCLENPRDGGAWWAAISGVTQSRTWLKWLSNSSSRCVCVCVRVGL